MYLKVELFQGGTIFRLVSAIKVKRCGVCYVVGNLEEPDYVECIRKGVLIPTEANGNVLIIKTFGFAEEIIPSVKFWKLVAKIANALVDLTPYLQEHYSMHNKR